MDIGLEIWVRWLVNNESGRRKGRCDTEDVKLMFNIYSTWFIDIVNWSRKRVL